MRPIRVASALSRVHRSFGWRSVFASQRGRGELGHGSDSTYGPSMELKKDAGKAEISIRRTGRSPARSKRDLVLVELFMLCNEKESQWKTPHDGEQTATETPRSCRQWTIAHNGSQTLVQQVQGERRDGRWDESDGREAAAPIGEPSTTCLMEFMFGFGRTTWRDR